MWSNVKVKTKTPSKRCKHAVCLLGQFLYLHGGKNTSFFKDFWRLDLRAGAWEEVKCQTPGPPALIEHTMVEHDNKLYLFGGEITMEKKAPVWIFDISNGSWRRSVNNSGLTPEGRRGHSAFVYGQYMYIHGGYRDLRGSLADLWAYHFNTESWILMSTSPVARHSHSSVIDGTSLYVFGGTTNLEIRSDLWHYDIRTKMWKEIKKKGPGPLKGASAEKALGSMFLLWGEKRDGKVSDDIWKFHFRSESWERLTFHGTKPDPKIFPAVAMLPAIFKNKTAVHPSQISRSDSYEELCDLPSRVPNNGRRKSGGYHPISMSIDSPGDDSETEVSVIPIKKSNSVRFELLSTTNNGRGRIPNSTSDYVSMDSRINSFENPNYGGSSVGESIEMNLMERSSGSEGPSSVTTPNYLLVLGGVEKNGNNLFGGGMTLWRLRVSHELSQILN